MIDVIDQQLIAALLDDSRCSLKTLAGITGLSSPSVGGRLGRLAGRGGGRGSAGGGAPPPGG